MSEQLLKAEQVAERLGVTKPYVYKLGRDGLLPRVVLPGDVVRFRSADIDAFIETNVQTGAPDRERPRLRGHAAEPAIPARF